MFLLYNLCLWDLREKERELCETGALHQTSRTFPLRLKNHSYLGLLVLLMYLKFSFYLPSDSKVDPTQNIEASICMLKAAASGGRIEEGEKRRTCK